MARRVRKVCPSCQQLFVGRRDAKTCSERCRKRLQRARLLLDKDVVLNFGPSSQNAVGVFNNRYSNTEAMASRRSQLPEGEL